MSEAARRNASAGLWQLRSEELYRAARVVWTAEVVPIPDGGAGPVEGDNYIHELYRPATLLMGLALETGFKGLIAATGKTVPFNHRLPELARDAAFTGLSAPREYLLAQLAAAITWTGRYPAPTKEQNLAGCMLVRRDDAFDVFDGLYSDVLRRLNSRVSGPPL